MLFSGDKKSRPILILEIQSSTVRGSLVILEPGSAPVMLHSQSIEVPFKPAAGTLHHVKSITRATQEICHLVAARLWTIAMDQKDSGISDRIHEVHYVLCSPWIISQAKTIAMSFEKESSISKDSLGKLLDDERNKMSAAAGAEIVTIEEKIFNIRLNGYPVAEWSGKHAKDIEVSYALSVGNKGLIEKLEDMARHSAQCKNVSFHSSLLLDYVYLTRGEKRHNSFILINIHGELTDVEIVRNDSCSFFGSFPIGINTIIRNVSASLKLDKKSTDSALSLYLGKHMGSQELATGAAITKESSAWASELSKICGPNGLREPLPQLVFVLAKRHESLFTEGLKLLDPRWRIESFPADPAESYALAIHKI